MPFSEALQKTLLLGAGHSQKLFEQAGQILQEPLPEGFANKLLQSHHLYLGGKTLPRAHYQAQPCPPEERPQPAQAAENQLAAILKGKQTDLLLPLYLEGCWRAGYSLPFRHLPALLNRARLHPHYVPQLLQTNTLRAGWLANQKKAWSFFPPLHLPPEQATGQVKGRSQRYLWLYYGLIGHGPALAQLPESWPKLTQADRQFLVGEWATHQACLAADKILEQEPQPENRLLLLQTLLQDEGHPLRRALRKAAPALISVQHKGPTLGKKPHCQVLPLAEWPREWQKALQIFSLAEAADLLKWLPPEAILSELELSPAAWFQALQQSLSEKNPTAFWSAAVHQLQTYPEPDFLATFLESPQTQSTLSQNALLDLLNLLPQPEKEAQIRQLGLLKRSDSKPVLQKLSQGVWSRSFCEELLEMLQQKPFMVRHLGEVALCLHPDWLRELGEETEANLHHELHHWLELARSAADIRELWGLPSNA